MAMRCACVNDACVNDLSDSILKCYVIPDLGRLMNMQDHVTVS